MGRVSLLSLLWKNAQMLLWNHWTNRRWDGDGDEYNFLCTENVFIAISYLFFCTQTTEEWRNNWFLSISTSIPSVGYFYLKHSVIFSLGVNSLHLYHTDNPHPNAAFLLLFSYTFAWREIEWQKQKMMSLRHALNYVECLSHEKRLIRQQQNKNIRVQRQDDESKKLIKLIAISSFSEWYHCWSMLLFSVRVARSFFPLLCVEKHFAPILIHFYFDHDELASSR